MIYINTKSRKTMEDPISDYDGFRKLIFEGHFFLYVGIRLLSLPTI